MRRLLVAAVVAALVPLSPVGAALPQNDAGSGTDAPDAADPAFRINSGTTYDGVLEGIAGDEDDWYAFIAPARGAVDATVAGALGCAEVYDASGNELASTCSIGFALSADLSFTAPYSGLYYLHYSYFTPDAYSFSVSVDAQAPPPTTLPEIEPLSSGGHVPRVRPASPRDKHVVVAVVDTGINPYHEFFRAPALTAHPSGWLPEFPRSARTVRLTLGAESHAAARAADAGVWASVERSAYDGRELDEHLYTFPGTRVVAGISFGEYTATQDVLGTTELRPVRDDDGHGTHSAGLALGANLGEADGNVVVVAVEVGKGTFEEGILWAAQQPWIDAISVSLGNVANVPTGVPNGVGGAKTGAPWATREAYAYGKPVFMAAGNGVSNTALAPDRCTTYTSPYAGPVWLSRIGAASAQQGQPAYWHCVPVEAIARTNVASPSFDSLDAADSASGTSAATPNAAGHWAHLMLGARRGGSRTSRLRVLEHLLHAASPPPVSPGAHDPSAYPASLASQGYGLIDERAVGLALTSVLANSAPAARPETTTWFQQDRALRIQLWGAPPEPKRS